jgi:hypothetical protein
MNRERSECFEFFVSDLYLVIQSLFCKDFLHFIVHVWGWEWIVIFDLILLLFFSLIMDVVCVVLKWCRYMLLFGVEVSVLC